jgi:hypothetical protein
MSVYLKEYFDYDDSGIKPRTTMRANRWFVFIDKKCFGGEFKPPTNYYDDRDGLIDGKMLFENTGDYKLPLNVKIPKLEFRALGPIGDLQERTIFKNVILKQTNTENVLLIQFDAFEYIKE